MRITPQRRSISRLQQESGAISWWAITAPDTQIQIQIRNMWHSSLLLPDEGRDFPRGAKCCVDAFETTFTGLTSGLWLFATSREGGKDNVCEGKKKRNTAGDEHTLEKKEKRQATTPPCTSRHWFIILISLISTAAPIFQMSFSNLCQTVWPFFLIQLMTSLVVRRICNSDWVFYRHSSRHTRVFVCLSLSVSAQYFGWKGLGAIYTREKLDSLQNMCLQGTKP